MKLRRLMFLAFTVMLAPLSAWPLPNLILRGSSSTNATVNPPSSTKTNAAVVAIPKETAVTITETNAEVRLSGPVREILKMADAGVTQDVLAAYIATSSSTFNLTPEGIIHLRDKGIPTSIINAMLAHDKALRDNAERPPASAPVETAPASGTTPGYQPGYQMPVAQPSASSSEYPDNPGSEAQPDYDNNPSAAASSFYNDLAPYGTWYNIEGAGWCWQPYAASYSSGWAPYCNDGRWLYCNYGWYWHSYYPWGWAPFHYGRWWNHPKFGWLWFPGTAWAPSWVRWRSSPDYCGWAPLSPFADLGFGANLNNFGFGPDRFNRFGNFDFERDDFTFVPFTHFGDHDLSRCRLDRAQVGSLLPNTTLAENNFAAGTGGVTVNRGIDPARMFATSQNPILRVNVEDAPDGGGVVPDRLMANSSSSSGFTIFRSPLPSAPLPETAQAIVVNPRAAVLPRAAPAPQVASRTAYLQTPLGAKPNQPSVTTRANVTVPATAPAGHAATVKRPSAVKAGGH